MKSVSFVNKAFCLVFASMLLGNGSARAYTGKQIGLALGGAAVVRLVWKADPSKNPVMLATLHEILGQLSQAMKEGNATEVTRLLVKLIDDGFIGYMGKSDGHKVAGTSITLEGDDVLQTVMMDGEEVRLLVKKGHPHYGLMATLFVKLDNLFKKWELLDKVYKLGTDEKGLFVNLTKDTTTKKS